jgi:tetratricopeptide (TPR) repeat protein
MLIRQLWAAEGTERGVSAMKKTVIVIIFALLVLCIPAFIVGCAPSFGEWDDEYYHEDYYRYQYEDYKRSWDEYAGHVKKGTQQMKEGRYAESAQEITSAIGDLLTANERCRRASHCTLDEKGAARSLATAYTIRGSAYGLQGRFNEAFADIDKALEHNPKHAQAYLARGVILESMGRTKDAIEAYKLCTTYALPSEEKLARTANQRIKGVEMKKAREK